MSLINEALKRAKEADKQPKTEVPAQKKRSQGSEPAMRPVEHKAQPASSSAVYVLSATLVFVLISAVVLLWMWSNSQGKRVAQTETVQPAAISPAPPQVVASVPAPVAVAKAPEQPIAPAPATPPPVTATSTAPNTTVAPAATVTTASVEPAPVSEPVSPAPAVPQFPTLKLQGIFYNATKPAAVINGKTYYVGGVVSGARITKIESEKVTVEWNSETRELETAQ